MYVFQFDTFTSLDYALDFCNRDDAVAGSPVFNWLSYGKLPESVTVYPSYGLQYHTANGINRYINNVTVLPVSTANISINLAAAATASFTFSGAKTATSADTAIATTAIVDGVVTITGVAAGTTTVKITDGTTSDNTIAIITVTVA